MKGHTLIKAFCAILIALFLTVQSYSIVHATEHAGHDHPQDCIACDSAVTAEDQAVIEPPIDYSTPPRFTSLGTSHLQFGQIKYANFDGRAPPPRGPPA